jgi:hypothetical protein
MFEDDDFVANFSQDDDTVKDMKAELQELKKENARLLEQNPRHVAAPGQQQFPHQQTQYGYNPFAWQQQQPMGPPQPRLTHHMQPQQQQQHEHQRQQHQQGQSHMQPSHVRQQSYMYMQQQ